MVAGLRMEAPKEGSTIVWGTFLPKIAGKKASFDVGLCKLFFSGDRSLYTGEDADLHWPSVEDYWYSEKEWFKNNIAPAEQGQELLDCKVDRTLECLDENQNGISNWHAYHDELEDPWDLKRKRPECACNVPCAEDADCA